MEPHLRAEYEAYVRAAKGPPVMVVLRTHLLTEYYLERVIRACLKRGDKLVDSGGLSFGNKLSVVEALDAVPDDVVTSLRNLNRVRNRCAHEFDRSISVADVDQIGGPFGKDYTQLKRDCASRIGPLLGKTAGMLTASLAAALHHLESLTSGQQNDVAKP